MIWKKAGTILVTGMLALCSALFLVPGQTVRADSDSSDYIDYSLIFDYNYYYDKYPDLHASCGKNPFKLFQHFVNNGMKEGRQGNEDFNVYNYAANNLDLIMLYGTSDLSLYYIEYLTEGHEDGRNCLHPYVPEEDDDDEEEKELSLSTLRSYANAMTTAINDARVSSELDRFAVSASLENAANARAQELLSNYSHVRPNGQSYTSILGQYGVSYANSYEIISSDQSSTGKLLSRWMGDANVGSVLTSKDYKYIGIGCASDVDGNVYWAVLLTY